MSPCNYLGGGKIMCTVGPMKVTRREPDGEVRWCYHCRSRVPFEFIVKEPVGPSWYGLEPSVQCVPKGHTDGDLFPGRAREWTAW